MDGMKKTIIDIFQICQVTHNDKEIIHHAQNVFFNYIKFEVQSKKLTQL